MKTCTQARPLAVEPQYFSRQVSAAQRFYLDLNPGETAPLTVISGGRETCRPEYTIDRAGFPHPIIEFVARGSGQVQLRDQSHPITTGSIFTYSRSVPHRITCDPKHPLTKYFIVLSGKLARQLMHDFHLDPGRTGRVSHPEQIQQIFEDLIRHGRDDHPDRHLMCAMVAQYLILKIGDLLVREERDPASSALTTYQRCRSHITNHYLTLRSLKDVAEACHVDQTYLCRLFQRFGRDRPARYLLHLKLNHAAELIQNSNLTIKEVADHLGFSDPYNFSRAFRRTFGVAPGALRNPAH